MDQRQKELIKQKTQIHQCELYIGQNISVAGWVMFIRKQGRMYFMKIYDSRKSRYSKLLQVIFEKTSTNQDYLQSLDNVTIGCSILIYGTIQNSPAKGQKIEMRGIEYYILGMVHNPSLFPSSKSNLTFDYIRTIENLECHVQVKSAIYSVRSELELATEKFFEQEGFSKCDMPLITFSECEGGCQPMQTTLFFSSGNILDVPCIKDTHFVDFSKDFFGKKAFLTVSAQLELETQLPQGKVWTMTRAVRGEPSQTSKHLCEFSMVEFELPFSTCSDDIIEISVKYIKFCLSYILTNCHEELEYLESFYSKQLISDIENWINNDFITITHAQAVEILLSNNSFSELPSFSSDLSSEHEKFLADVHFKSPVIIKYYPKCVKAFYMPTITETLEESHGVEHVDSFDIIVPNVGELVGGSQRIDNYDSLMLRINELGLNPEPLSFYTELRRNGSIPHGGMGLGFERFVKFITGAENVKDCVPYPRFIGSGKKY